MVFKYTFVSLLLCKLTKYIAKKEASSKMSTSSLLCRRERKTCFFLCWKKLSYSVCETKYISRALFFEMSLKYCWEYIIRKQVLHWYQLVYVDILLNTTCFSKIICPVMSCLVVINGFGSNCMPWYPSLFLARNYSFKTFFIYDIHTPTFCITKCNSSLTCE